jgi:hypothetical protein
MPAGGVGEEAPDDPTRAGNGGVGVVALAGTGQTLRPTVRSSGWTGSNTDGGRP